MGTIMEARTVRAPSGRETMESWNQTVTAPQEASVCFLFLKSAGCLNRGTGKQTAWKSHGGETEGVNMLVPSCSLSDDTCALQS